MFGAPTPPADVGVILGCFLFQIKVIIMACVLSRWDCRKVIGVVLNVHSTCGRRYILERLAHVGDPVLALILCLVFGCEHLTWRI